MSTDTAARTVFYSWQSDVKAAANRTLIEQALHGALADLHGRETPRLIEVDRDTAGVPGTPDIASTILEKIDKSAVVVADVTLVDERSEGRRVPNPNVLLEVGYAIKALGFNRLILVQNTFFGGPQNLPFDLRGRRVVGYRSDPEDSTRSEIRRKLSRQLLEALVGIFATMEDSFFLPEEAEALDLEATRRQIDALPREPTENLEGVITDLISRIDNSSVSDKDYADLMNQIVGPWKKRRSMLPDRFLLDIVEKGISRHPTATGYFDRGLLTGRIGDRYNPIAAYMNAVALGDSNPSLCYLNAGNRFRELNDYAIAISFYEKSIALNKKQSNAWLGAAQLYSALNEIPAAIRSYQGYLEWYNQLPISHQLGARAQIAGQARHYITTHGADSRSAPAGDPDAGRY